MRGFALLVDTLVFDFDNTIALGSGPVEAYAKALENEEPNNVAIKGLHLAVAEQLRAYPDGQHPEFDSIDPYDLVRIQAMAYGAQEDSLERAYWASREVLAAAEAPIFPPEGLSEFLHEMREEHPDDLRIVLVTNAPNIRITEALEALGLTGIFDQVITSAKKPTGMTTIVQPWITEGRVLSIGDIWANDLAPVQDLGGDTALIASQTSDFTPTYYAAQMTELYPYIQTWVRAKTAVH